MQPDQSDLSFIKVLALLIIWYKGRELLWFVQITNVTTRWRQTISNEASSFGLLVSYFLLLKTDNRDNFYKMPRVFFA